VVALLAGALWLCAAGAGARESVAKLRKKLLSHDDYRVRTQAALALGASRSTSAVTPLCRGLEDKRSTVRAASAAGLGKLRKGGVKCLKRRLDEEESKNVRKMIKKAIRLNEEAAAGPQLDSARLYLAIGKTRDLTGRGGGKIHSLVRSVVAQKAQSNGGCVLAPPGETAAQAQKRLKRHGGVDAYYLAAKVHAPLYSNSRLEIRVEMELYSYPGKMKQGSVMRSIGMSGVPDRDTEKEDQLIEKAAGRAMQEFLRMAGG
jgi:hypothetical protein